MSRGAGRRARRALISATALLEGVGLHSGADASLRVRPAPAGTGLVFEDQRTGQEIPALAANVAETARCTRLEAGGARIQTVEHIISALAGLGIADAVIETTGEEVPAADGSAAPFVALLRAAGLRDQGSCAREEIALHTPILLTGEGGSVLTALPAESFRATVVIDYPQHPFIGTQAVTYDAETDDYTLQIAPARTFGFLAELDWLRAHGLALGASPDNAVVLRDDGYETALRFPDELARHKLLDLIGDLALAGRPLRAHVLAIKPGHALNTQLARFLAAHGDTPPGDY